MKSLTHITIPANVITIGPEAFAGDSKLTNISIPNSVRTIDHGAFAKSGLTAITIPPLVTEISESVFSETSLTSVEVPASVVSIGAKAFQIATLTSLTFAPNSNLVSIADSAFDQSHLTELNLGSKVSAIGQHAFENMNFLQSIFVSTANQKFSSDVQGVLYDKQVTRLIFYPQANPQTSYTVPNSLVGLDSNSIAFILTLVSYSYCSNLISDADLYSALIGIDEKPLPRTQCLPSAPVIVDAPSAATETTSVSVTSISGSDQTRMISGALLSGVKQVLVNGVAVIFSAVNDEALNINVPDLSAGRYDIELIGDSGELTWQEGLVIKPTPSFRVPPVPTSVTISHLTISGFSGNSAVLTSQIMRQIRAATSNAKQVTCSGGVFSTKLTSADKSLALKRARNACAYLRSLNSMLVMRVKTSPSAGLGVSARNVTIAIKK
jgi:hypothetical protein